MHPDTDCPPPNSHARRRDDPQPLDEDIWLTQAQVLARLGRISKMSLWRWRNNPQLRFPAPIRLNDRCYWRAGDVRAWQAERAAMAEQKVP
jgi:predicted DNA-binding transcriptional regulator AlpA